MDKSYLKLGLLFLTGMAPISAISFRVFEFVDLNTSFLSYVLPLYLICLVLSLTDHFIRSVSLRGLLIGGVAVFVYDLVRWSLSYHLSLDDFIPKIGQWLLQASEPNFFVGYAWRYLGNGGGMGISFLSILMILDLKFDILRKLKSPRKYIYLGLSYGVLIWLCLLLTLTLSLNGQKNLFFLDTAYFFVTLIGHITYGGVLGGLSHMIFANQSTEKSRGVVAISRFLQAIKPIS